MTDNTESEWAKFLSTVKACKPTKPKGKPLCYCDSGGKTILTDLVEGSIPDEALVRNCCWSEICRINGRNYDAANDEEWAELCRKRTYLLMRQDPPLYGIEQGSHLGSERPSSHSHDRLSKRLREGFQLMDDSNREDSVNTWDGFKLSGQTVTFGVECKNGSCHKHIFVARMPDGYYPRFASEDKSGWVRCPTCGQLNKYEQSDIKRFSKS